MDEIIAGATPWILLVIGAVAGVVVAELWKRAEPPLIRWRARVGASRAMRRGRRRNAQVKNPRQSTTFADYFREQDDRLDIGVYELSLRPDVPVMDLLYFEYLRSRIAAGSINEVVVIPWSGWRDDANAEGEQTVQERVRAIFGDYSSRVTVVTADDLQVHGTAIFDNRFFEQVGNLGDSEFLEFASSAMGYRFRSYEDINRSHPDSHRARSIVEHTVRGWLIFKYLESSRLDQAAAPLKIGSLMWEQELTKLLMLRNLEEHDGVECSVMVGRTVSFGRRRRKAIPTFDRKAIEVFGDIDEMRELLSKKSRAELRTTQKVLNDILDARPKLSVITAIGSPHPADENLALNGDALGVLRTLRIVRALYGVRDPIAVKS